MGEIIDYLEVFWVFFITNILGYGGGPATIPLVQHEVTHVYGWMTEFEFTEMLAVGNTLPGPIATKMAGSIGFSVVGWSGVFIALVATVVPSLILKILLMNFLLKHKESPQVRRLSLYVKPTIAMLLAMIMMQNFTTAFYRIGVVHMIILTVASFFLLKKKKMHPSLVILGALVYGGLIGMF